MAMPLITGEATFTSRLFSAQWILWWRGDKIAVLIRHPRQHTSDIHLPDGSEILLRPDGWGTVVAIERDKEWGRIVRRSWLGRRWDLISPTFGYSLTSDPIPRRWTLRLGNEPIGYLSGGWLSYNRLEVHTDVAVQALPLMLAWHVLARSWEAASAPGSLVPYDPQRGRPTLGIDG